MTANMLAAYYDKECDSSDLFDNLKIAQNEDYKTHLNKYNVIAYLKISNFKISKYEGTLCQYILLEENI